ncbi:MULTISPECIES: DUF5591 domain-containing protein [Bacillus]|uniref:DUF5591 domain-containing protein n=1 Tax=Bacillus TaxID=1386 RepID=UPI000700F175|nr:MULTISPECIES: DUF5591 domain-containing protein [Bacillus]KQU13977.1 radical SAM protein [Bacillus sp. Leaf49]MCM3064404.1 DUF5591 domain-containing protein [Bacillus altitudinis]MCM3076676.1 DUF5591 domain-containing protein [Bacillus altitudinis]MCY7449628.1 DUF5591 domain-containing protein [Bacillus altitudinis]MCY7621753.1 DUF5591 domain-containing protein [Bacillus altitudinis]
MSSTYPNFPEYKLKNIYKGETFFKRGATSDHIFHEEFEQWQKFFCSDEYLPPAGKDIILFQVCTWAKPYDFSYIGKKIRKITNKFERIHPIILSNAGVIPYEYQMNPAFCAYDWIQTEDISEEEALRMKKLYQDSLLNRIKNYLTSKQQHYKAVVHYCMPIKDSIVTDIHDFCKTIDLTYFHTPGLETFRSSKGVLTNLKDWGEFYILDPVLNDLENTLKKVSSIDRSVNRNTSL